MGQDYAVLDLCYSWEGEEQHLHPVVLLGRKDVVLVDCGYPGSLAQLEEQLARHGLDPAALTTLVLTHQDDDHMGSAAALKAKYPQIQIAASPLEAPYLSGAQKNLRLRQAGELQAALPPEQQAWGEAFCARLRAVSPVAVDLFLRPGDTFDWAGGCTVVATPGHTPGHLSLHLTAHDLMITGDAAVWENGGLVVANPQFCLDLPAAEASLARLKACRCRDYLCYHGGFGR